MEAKDIATQRDLAGSACGSLGGPQPRVHDFYDFIPITFTGRAKDTLSQRAALNNWSDVAGTD
jgi:hypothetical protein